MNAIVQYRIIPFTQWSNIIYETKSIKISDVQRYEYPSNKVVITNEDVEKYLKNIENEPINEEASEQNNDMKITNEESHLDDFLKCTLLSNDIFTPSPEYIENIGYGEITQYQFPSIFMNENNSKNNS